MNKKDFYIDQYKKYHTNPTAYPGNDTLLDIKFIVPLIDKFKAQSLLDFGCGKGYQYTKDKVHEKHYRGIMPALYDPGIPEYAQFPSGKFDGVFSCDVLEHVPEDSIMEVLQQIYSKANKFALIAVSNCPSIAILPNGENAHVTQKPYWWWIDKICKVSTVDTVFVVRGRDRFVGYISDRKLKELIAL